MAVALSSTAELAPSTPLEQVNRQKLIDIRQRINSKEPLQTDAKRGQFIKDLSFMLVSPEVTNNDREDCIGAFRLENKSSKLYIGQIVLENLDKVAQANDRSAVRNLLQVARLIDLPQQCSIDKADQKELEKELQRLEAKYPHNTERRKFLRKAGITVAATVGLLATGGLIASGQKRDPETLPSPPKPDEEPDRNIYTERGVPLESFLEPSELKRSELVREIVSEFLDRYTFKATIDGKEFDVPLPFAEAAAGYTFPRTPYPDGSIPSKMTPEVAQQRFSEKLQSGEFLRLFHESLARYKGIDPNSLSANDRLAHSNIASDQELTADEKYAFYNSLRQIGIYGDCNGTVYNGLAYIFDRIKGGGAFDQQVRRIFPDLNIPHPVTSFNIGRFGDSRWAENVGQPPVKDLKAGEVIALGDEFHSILIVGWDPEKRALLLLQNTDEARASTKYAQGLHMFPVYITDPDQPIQSQEWGAMKIADNTTLPDQQGGTSYSERLNTERGRTYKVFHNKLLQSILDQATNNQVFS